MYCKSKIKSQNGTPVIKSWPCTWYKWQWFLLRTLISLTEYGYFYFKDFSQNFVSGVANKKEKSGFITNPISCTYDFLSFLYNLFSSFLIWSSRWCKWVFFIKGVFFFNFQVIAFFFNSQSDQHLMLFFFLLFVKTM